MIVVDGIENSIIGWAKLGRHRVVIYSVDRLSLLIEEDIGDETTVKDVEEIIRFLEISSAERAVEEKVPPPIFVHSGDESDITRIILEIENGASD
tara:strand:- start:39 stop:323 length:285 start_codon:yes stop_codon:yes gene_type:complete